ncbi:MAG: O-antigen ligase family protein [Verrucomicrobiota bacterium]
MRRSTSIAQITLILLFSVLLSGPIVLGAIRPWIYLPPFFILLVIAIIGCCRAVSVFRISSWKPDWIDLSAGLFVLYTLGRSSLSLDGYDSRLESMKVVAYAITFFTCRYGIQRRIHGILILSALLALGVGVSLFGFFLKTNPDFHPFGETFHLHYAPRLTATYGCPNHVGFFLVMTTSIALSLGFFSHLSWIKRILILYTSVPMIAAIGFTLSRGSWIALIFAILAITIIALRLEKIKKWVPITFLFFIVIGAVSFVLLNQDFKSRLTEGFDTETLKVNDQYIRIQLVMDTVKIFKDHPLLGTGPATFLYVHPRYQGPHYPSLAVFAHNDYANTLADYGLIGLFIALLFVVFASIKLSRHPRSGEEWHDRVFLSIGAASMSALIIHSFVDFNLHIPANAIVFFALIGLGLRLTNESRPFGSPSKIQHGSLLLAGLILCVFFFQLQKTARGYFPTWSIQRQESSTPWVIYIQTLEEAAKQDSDSPFIASALGDAYRFEAAKHQEKQERFPLAIKGIYWYEKAHQLNPLDDTITIRLAMAYDLMERYMESYQYYRMALKNQPYSGYFWVELASHYWRQGLLTKARDAYEAALGCPYQPSDLSLEMNLLNQEIEKAREQIRIEKEKEASTPSASSANPAAL